MMDWGFIRGIILNKNPENLDGYVRNLSIIEGLTEIEFRKPVTFFVGENGSGKSTLLEAIAIGYGFNPEGGTKNFCFSSNETHSNLHEYITVVKGVKRPKDGFFLRAESFYNVATEIDRLDSIGGASLLASYGGKSLHKQSHGESFLSLVINRFNNQGLYILDEPEAALSPSRQLALLSRINQLVKGGSQLLIATHSPILMAYPEAEIYLAEYNKNLRRTKYEETEHYNITRDFLNCPERMLKYLFEEN